MKLSDKELLYLQAKETYYAGEPIMEDWEFDTLEAELEEISSPALKMVGYKTKGVKVKHPTPMKSLQKIQFQHGYTPLHEFCLWAEQADLSEEYEGSPKFDGNAVNLIYKGGKLLKAVTRGDGEEGQDITEKMRYRVPNTIEIKGDIEIRGEAAMKTKIFNSKYGPGTGFRKTQEPSATDDYKNPRNFVAGMLSRDNLEKNILDDLDFLGFEIKTAKDKWVPFPFEQLKALGFEKIFHRSYYGDKLMSIESMDNMHKTWADYREECPYQLDGWVLKMRNHLRTPAMESSHHPKWALAIKFPAKVGLTKIIDIEWNLGTTGILVPTGILEPVDLDGSTVQRVSLHNFEWAGKQDLGIGAEIELVKSGDIIPKVHRILKIGAKIVPPVKYKGHKVYQDGPHLHVENSAELPEMKALKLHQAFVILGMKGIGPSMTERLVDAGWTEYPFIFQKDFTKEALIKSEKFVEGRELDILFEIVDKVQDVEYWKLMAAMKCDGYGKTVCKQIANFLCNVDYDFAGLEKALWEPFIKGEAGEKLKDLKYIETVFEKKGIKIIKPVKLDLSKVGGFYEATGSPKEHGFPVKSDFDKLASDKGYIHSKLDKNCNFLLTDSMSSTSSKMAKAKKLGVEIITYSDFAEKYLK